MAKTFYFDVETTGVDKIKNGLTQFAAIVVIDGEEVDSISLDINTDTYIRDIDVAQEALDVTGKTIEMITSYPSQQEQFKKLINFLDTYIDRYNKEDKFTPAGYNVQFDLGFLQEWFKENDHKFFGSYFHYKDADVFSISKILKHLGITNLPNDKLGTLCEHYGVDLGEDAHDAVADIRATRDLYIRMVDEHFKLPANYNRP